MEKNVRPRGLGVATLTACRLSAFCRKGVSDGGWLGHIIPAAALHAGVLYQALPSRPSAAALQ